MKINRNKCENIQNPENIFDKTVLSDFFVVEIVTIKYYKVNDKVSMAWFNWYYKLVKLTLKPPLKLNFLAIDFLINFLVFSILNKCTIGNISLILICKNM